MKLRNLLPIITAVILVSSCSSHDDEDGVSVNTSSNVPVNTQYFHPPTWIQGEWAVAGTTTPYLRFTNDDFILAYNTDFSYKYTLQQVALYGGTVKVDETINDTEYNFTIYTGTTASLKFKKTGVNTMIWQSGQNISLVKL